MSISKSYLEILGAPVGETNPLPFFRDKSQNANPLNNGTMTEDQLVNFGYQSTFRMLPYKKQDRYTRNRDIMKIKTVEMENEYLKAVFFPEYGGRLYSLFDKRTGQEIFYKNPVMQPCNLAIRDAWFSGGIEWNIAQVGHTYSTCDDVFFAMVQSPDGYEFVRMYDYERTRGLVWQIDFHLPKGSEQLIIHTKIRNELKHTVPMYWWTNIAVREEEGCRVFSSTKSVIFLDPGDESNNKKNGFGSCDMPFISTMKEDASYPLNFRYGSEYFFQNPKTLPSPWEAITYNDGTVVFDRSTQPLFARKMFCWGTHNGGRHWRDFLSEDGKGDYVEIQAGLAPTQLHGFDMDAESTIEFTQIFGATSIDAGSANKESYDDSREIVTKAIENCLTAEQVLAIDAKYGEFADLACGEILHMGTGWGALENLKRGIEGTASLPIACNFSKDSLSQEQEIWIDVLNKKDIKDISNKELPISYITDMTYEKYLKDMPQNTTTKLLLSVMYFENGKTEEAIAICEEIANSSAHPMSYRNLAYSLNQEKKYDEAIAYMEKIDFDLYTKVDFALLQEYTGMLVHTKQWQKLFDLYCSLPAEYQSPERIYLNVCEAAFHLEKWDFLKEAFKKEYAVIREGETNITKLWLAYADVHGIPKDDIPKALDFRMKEDN